MTEAIKRCSAELDVAAMAYLGTMTAEMEAVIGDGNFKFDVFLKDVIITTSFFSELIVSFFVVVFVRHETRRSAQFILGRKPG